ncbi:hypothetical protein PV728_01580 [Streptomyces europaeiscabiei]|uniref:hypothetical protein n=1 Tax=Streptomyces europaeiscabiei TaxID=146819 RepID=UPI0029ABE8F3|nr:hypothetical protein [Streptomyces europaeiscabiei]MDX3629019.1 hypothetical protein [Streptomyces europaeiscabiei]MDX3647363.1 hypothetical protein [Streptomyces europaeiscabiei]
MTTDTDRPVWPHLPYYAAVYTALVAEGLRPEITEVGRRERRAERELYVRLVWLPGHEDLEPDMRLYGMTLAWSHLGGWVATSGPGQLQVRTLLISDLASPAAVVEAALNLTQDGIDTDWQPSDLTARWENAGALDMALVSFDAQGAWT